VARSSVSRSQRRCRWPLTRRNCLPASTMPGGAPAQSAPRARWLPRGPSAPAAGSRGDEGGQGGGPAERSAEEVFADHLGWPVSIGSRTTSCATSRRTASSWSARRHRRPYGVRELARVLAEELPDALATYANLLVEGVRVPGRDGRQWAHSGPRRCGLLPR
jgi:hypothetical protein